MDAHQDRRRQLQNTRQTEKERKNNASLKMFVSIFQRKIPTDLLPAGVCRKGVRWQMASSPGLSMSLFRGLFSGVTSFSRGGSSAPARGEGPT